MDRNDLKRILAFEDEMTKIHNKISDLEDEQSALSNRAEKYMEEQASLIDKNIKPEDFPQIIHFRSKTYKITSDYNVKLQKTSSL